MHPLFFLNEICVQGFQDKDNAGKVSPAGHHLPLPHCGQPGELQDGPVHDADKDQGEDAEGEPSATHQIIPGSSCVLVCLFTVPALSVQQITPWTCVKWCGRNFLWRERKKTLWSAAFVWAFVCSVWTNCPPSVCPIDVGAHMWKFLIAVAESQNEVMPLWPFLWRHLEWRPVGTIWRGNPVRIPGKKPWYWPMGHF